MTRLERWADRFVGGALAATAGALAATAGALLAILVWAVFTQPLHGRTTVSVRYTPTECPAARIPA